MVVTAVVFPVAGAADGDESSARDAVRGMVFFRERIALRRGATA
jgi:hypothetical protein